MKNFNLDLIDSHYLPLYVQVLNLSFLVSYVLILGVSTIAAYFLKTFIEDSFEDRHVLTLVLFSFFSVCCFIGHQFLYLSLNVY